MIRIHKGIFVSIFFLAIFAVPGYAVVCDVDKDGDVDREDIDLIFVARDTPASGTDNPRDEDSDGTITILDGRRCALQCTYPNCMTNKIPQAKISGPQEPVCYGMPVTLDGGGSRDGEDASLSYKWTLTKPDNSQAKFSDTTAQAPTFVADVKGQYEAKLVVSDGTSHSTPASLTMTARGPKAEAGQDHLKVKIGETVKLNGGNSSACSNNALTYSWKLNKPDESKSKLSDPTAAAPHFVADVAGRYDAALIVNDGINSEPDTVIIETDSGLSLKCDDLAEGTIDESRKTGQFTFEGQEGDIVTLTLVDTTDSEEDSRRALHGNVYEPSGDHIRGLTTADPEPPYEDNRENQETLTLPKTGTYTFEVVATGLEAGDVAKYSIGLECTQPTTPIEAELSCGDRYDGEIMHTAATDLFTFHGEKNQLMNVGLAKNKNWQGYGTVDATIFQPSGEELTQFSYTLRGGLPETGTYVILVNASGYTRVGKYSIWLECTWPTTAPIKTELGCGDRYDGKIKQSRESHLFTFYGERDHFAKIILRGIDQKMGAVLYTPTGEEEVSFHNNNLDDREIHSLTLPETGTYTILVGTPTINDAARYSIELKCSQPSLSTETDMR